MTWDNRLQANRERAHDHTLTLQIMVQVLCDGTWCDLATQEIGCSRCFGRVRHVSIDCGFYGEEESEEQVTPMLVIRERRHKMTWAMLVSRKGTEFPCEESSEVHSSAWTQQSHTQMRQRTSN